MNTATRCIRHIDCTLYRTPTAARRMLTQLIRQGPGTIVFHQLPLGEGWMELVRTAYESGQDVQLSACAAPTATKEAEGKVLWAETCSTNGLSVCSWMSLEDRILLIQRLGYPRAECAERGSQDFAASVLRELADLIEQTADTLLIEKANGAIGRWNTQCITRLEKRIPHASEISVLGKD